MKGWKCLLAVALVVGLSGCKTKERIVYAERVRSDTLVQMVQLRDSIYLHDSTAVRVMGDTVEVTRWHVAYKERVKTDTVYRVKTDTVRMAYETVREVPKKVKVWDRVRIFGGGFALAVILLLYFFVVRKK